MIAQARPEDIAIGISTSGGSRNIVVGLEEARKRKMLTVALLGYDGGEISRRRLADFPIVVNCDYIPRIQEVQASIYHVLRESLHLLDHDFMNKDFMNKDSVNHDLPKREVLNRGQD